MVILKSRNLGWGWRNSGITTNEDFYYVWLKTLGYSSSVLGRIFYGYFSSTWGTSLILAVPRASFWGLPLRVLSPSSWFYQGRQYRVRARVRTWIPLLVWHSLLLGYSKRGVPTTVTCGGAIVPGSKGGHPGRQVVFPWVPPAYQYCCLNRLRQLATKSYCINFSNKILY